jgi:hypothetical protein
VLKRRQGCPRRACHGLRDEGGSRNGFAQSWTFGARLLEGEGTGGAGQWASSARTGGGAGPRAVREWPGRRRRNRGGRSRGRRRKGEGLLTGGTEQSEDEGAAVEMTEKEMEMTEKRRND